MLSRPLAAFLARDAASTETAHPNPNNPKDSAVPKEAQGEGVDTTTAPKSGPVGLPCINREEDKKIGKGRNKPERGSTEPLASAGYCPNLVPSKCERLDAVVAARKDQSVDLGFDSLALEVVVDLGAQRLKR